MGKDDWKGVCDEMAMPSKRGLIWPIPITLSAEKSLADSIKNGEEVAPWDTEQAILFSGAIRAVEVFSDHWRDRRNTSPGRQAVGEVI